MSRDRTPHEWADFYTASAYSAQRDADNHAKAADQAEQDGNTARAHYLHTEAAAHQRIADNYRESAAKTTRLAERLDDQRRAYGRAMRLETDQ